MPKKFCVYGCKTNYQSTKNNNSFEKIPVYRFPKDKEQRNIWIQSIPNSNLLVTDETVICQLHWPACFETVTVHGKQRPKIPPSVWPGIPISQIPTPLPRLRTSNKSLSDFRNIVTDELSTFLFADMATYDHFKDVLLNNLRTFSFPLVTYMVEKTITIQSITFNNGIPLFLVKIFEDLHFETFHYGVKCFIKSLSRNRITIVDSWSKFEEIIHFLNVMETDHKKNIIQQQISVMSAKLIGNKIYNSDVVIRSFEYFSTSRALYNQLRNDFQLLQLVL